MLAVNITSITPVIPHDQSCILKAGDHEFVKHDSYVYYRKADIFSAEKIVNALNDGSFIIHADFDEDTFGKILNGFEVSTEVSYKNKRFYEKYCKVLPE
ncbi:hypothetical protein [Shewanella sp. WE21]|uniref:hypothetical protein n=1 Tax=Shewanella sp. WE21 TaxID=2029986 RepID=UPI001C1F9442|nr:hypothetical protein [Shewanella sp. WE21]